MSTVYHSSNSVHIGKKIISHPRCSLILVKILPVKHLRPSVRKDVTFVTFWSCISSTCCIYGTCQDANKAASSIVRLTMLHRDGECIIDVTLMHPSLAIADAHASWFDVSRIVPTRVINLTFTRAISRTSTLDKVSIANVIFFYRFKLNA